MFCFLLQYLCSDYKELCHSLEPLLTVREKEDFATCLVHVLQKQRKACEFLSDIVMEEISQLGGSLTIIRSHRAALLFLMLCTGSSLVICFFLN